MGESFGSRLKHGWNAFLGKETTQNATYQYGMSYSRRPDRVRLRGGNEKSIITAVYNRIAIDVASITIQHVKLDQNGRYIETIKSGLNNCLTLEANIDQTAQAFFIDAVMSMFDEGVIGIVPVDTSINPLYSGSWDINTMRVGKIIEWMPKHVRVKVYNDVKGIDEEVVLPKSMVAIIENPLYSVMNEPNSTLKRLIHKLNLLDSVDEQSGSGKLDLLIQLPYELKSDLRKQQAETRRKDIEMQLQGSKYGIAYTGAAERVTQLNRPVENNLMKQVEYLTSMLYNQLGMTQDIFDGKADEQAMLNYYNRTIDPIVNAFVGEMIRKFLTKTARTQGHTIMYFRDPFKLVPVEKLADIADKFTRNEIVSSNEFRHIIGYKPSNDPRADELRNKNINSSNDQPLPTETSQEASLE